MTFNGLKLKCILSSLPVVIALLLSLASKPAAAQTLPPGLSNIQHIVFIVKENRSFDEYFGTFPGANGATTGLTSTGQVIPLGQTNDAMPNDICHDWACLLAMMDYGRMDHFDLDPTCTADGRLYCYSQMSEANIPNYFALAKNFVLGDNMFSSLHGTSFPNHVYMIAATSAGFIGQAHLPTNFALHEVGCSADPTSTAQVIDSNGNISNQYPCVDVQTRPRESPGRRMLRGMLSTTPTRLSITTTTTALCGTSTFSHTRILPRMRWPESCRR
jgi:phospholipase C